MSSDSFAITTKVRAHWEAYAAAKQQAEDSLLLRDGITAARAFYCFVEVFVQAGALGPNVLPISLHRQRRAELRGQQ